MGSEREYIYVNKPIELAVNNIKANLFEIIAREEGVLHNLESELGLEVNAEKKNDLQTLIDDQNSRLDHTLDVCNELFKEVEYLDSFTHDLNEMKSDGIKKYVQMIDDKKITNAYNKDLKNGEAEVAKVQEEIVAQVSNDENLSEKQEEVVESVNEIVEQPIAKKVESPTPIKEFVPDKIVSDVDANEVIDTPVTEDVVAEKIVSEPVQEDNNEVISESVQEETNEVVNEIAQDNVVEDVAEESDDIAPVKPIKFEVPTVPIMKPDGVASNVVSSNEKEVPEEVEEKTDENKVDISNIDISQLLSPIDETENTVSEVVEDTNNITEETSDESVTEVSDTIPADINEEVSEMEEKADVSGIVTIDDVADKQLEAIEEVKEEIVNDPDKSAIAKKIDLFKYRRATNDVVRAILVSKKQYDKCLASLDTQESLLTLRGELGDNLAATNTIGAVDNKLEEIKSDTTNVNTDNLEDKQSQLESMMEQANSLYKSGKADEAQALYDKISVMNKELTKGNELVKK